MFAFIFDFLFLLAGGSSHSGGFLDGIRPYINYPGFEAWKFVNLAIFVGGLIYLIRKPLSETFKAKREEIRAGLIKAEEEKQAALARLTEAESKLARIEGEKAAIKDKAKAEAESESSRIREEMEAEIARLREQANNEITRSGQATKLGLRKFSAEESIRMAEELIRKGMNDKADAELVKAATQAMGGLK